MFCKIKIVCFYQKEIPFYVNIDEFYSNECFAFEVDSMFLCDNNYRSSNTISPALTKKPSVQTAELTYCNGTFPKIMLLSLQFKFIHDHIYTYVTCRSDKTTIGNIVQYKHHRKHYTNNP